VYDSLTVSTRMDDDDFDFSLHSLKEMFLEPHNVILWSIPLGLAILLRVITHKFHHPLIFPLCLFFCSCYRSCGYLLGVYLDFVVIPLIFYIFVAAAQLKLGNLRESGWLFDLGSAGEDPWYKFYSYFG
jgi:sulfate permease, SulP family